ncbi:MAG TPA: PDGLE domain-containing protein [Nitrospirota bacterium]|nr:PDGLE domain-containing protein [Nitrospirota bacterium]
MSSTKKLWIGIGILILLSPLGLILPALFGAGGAWGEWGLGEIEKLSGFVPQGMKRLADFWKAPLPDYAIPGQGRGLGRESAGYFLAGLIGVAATAGIMYVIARILAKKSGRK